MGVYRTASYHFIANFVFQKYSENTRLFCDRALLTHSGNLINVISRSRTIS